MKKVLTAILLIAGTYSFAQTATASSASSVQSTAPLSAKAKALCKTWALSKTEVFGDQHDPTDQQKNDQLVLMENGRYRLIYEGKAEGGTWSLDKSGIWLTLVCDDGSKKMFKVVESTDASLKVDYKDTDDVHNILYYSAGKAVAAPSSGR